MRDHDGGKASGGRVIAGALLACALVFPPALPDDAPEAARCGGAGSLRSAFERHVRAFNTPRDIETVLDFEENMVEFGHGGHPAQDFSSMSREEHRRLLVEGTARKELYEWLPDPYEVRVVGSAGLVWGLYVRRQRPRGGETVTDRGRFTATYVCVDGAWRAALWHRSPLREAPAEDAP